MAMAAETDIPRLLGEIASLADEVGDVESARRAGDELRAVSAQTARVVVVGEKKRGKSSLINALLRRPGLLPVDADIATSVHITVFAADSEQAAVVDETHPEGFAIPLSEVGEYAALDIGSREMRHPGVREVSVGLPDPLLRADLDLIDTPGVGGLVAGHAALTLAALTLADALLFVVNGSSELTDSECEFLKRATERIATVVFVLAQTDKYPEWRQVLAADQALIAKHAPEFAKASWFAVSSRNRQDAARAAADGRAERAATLEQRSGFGPLEDELTRQIAGRASELRDQNAAFVARRVLDKLISDQERRQRSLARDPKLIEAVRAKKAALDAAARADATWRRELGRLFGTLGKESSLLYQRSLVALQVDSERWVATADTATASQIAHDYDAGLRAVWTDVEARTREGALAIAAHLADMLGADGIDALDADVPYPEQLAARQLLLTSEPEAKGFGGKLARLMPNLQGVSMASMVGHLLFSAINPFAVFAIGGLLAGLVGGDRRDQAARARARADVQRHIQSVSNQARFEFGNALGDLIKSLQDQLTETIEDRMRARRDELSAAIAEASRHLEESEQVLAPQREACERVLARLRELSSRAGQLTAIEGAAGIGGAGGTAQPALPA
jgi:GTPase SAR1 family protein